MRKRLQLITSLITNIKGRAPMTRKGTSPHASFGPAASRPQPHAHAAPLLLTPHRRSSGQGSKRGSVVTPWRAKGHPRLDLPRGRRSSSRGLHDDVHGAWGARWERHAHWVCLRGGAGRLLSELLTRKVWPGVRVYKCGSNFKCLDR